MQRIAALVLCAALWSSNASAQGCSTIADVVGGFTGGASGYGLMRNIGPVTNWLSAGLYGAGIAVGALGGRRFATGVCEHIEAVMKMTAEIYCFSGEYLCESLEDIARSMTRDFQLCSECTPDEVMDAFPMEDSAREQHLIDMQIRRGAPATGLPVIPRNYYLSGADPDIGDSYYAGLQASFRLQRALQRQLRLD